MFVQRAYVHKAITLSYPVGGGMIRNKKLCRLLEERGQEVGSLLALLGGLLLGGFLQLEPLGVAAVDRHTPLQRLLAQEVHPLWYYTLQNQLAALG